MRRSQPGKVPRMTTIDASAGIDIVWEQQQATVRIPLDDQTSPQWFRRYRALARQRGLQAWAEGTPTRGWVVVELADGAGPEEVTASLDAARDLITEADATGDPPDPEETDRVVRDWWQRQQRG
jgi:hypothetical protein